MTLQVIQPATVHDTTASSYAHAVRMGELIFVCGQGGRRGTPHCHRNYPNKNFLWECCRSVYVTD